jgi:hypothetical protein
VSQNQTCPTNRLVLILIYYSPDADLTCIVNPTPTDRNITFIILLILLLVKRYSLSLCWLIHTPYGFTRGSQFALVHHALSCEPSEIPAESYREKAGATGAVHRESTREKRQEILVRIRFSFFFALLHLLRYFRCYSYHPQTAPQKCNCGRYCCFALLSASGHP